MNIRQKIYINKIYIERALKYAESGNDILRTLEKFKKNCLGNKHELNCPNYKRLLFPLEED